MLKRLTVQLGACERWSERALLTSEVAEAQEAAWFHMSSSERRQEEVDAPRERLEERKSKALDSLPYASSDHPRLKTAQGAASTLP